VIHNHILGLTLVTVGECQKPLKDVLLFGIIYLLVVLGDCTHRAATVSGAGLVNFPSPNTKPMNAYWILVVTERECAAILLSAAARPDGLFRDFRVEIKFLSIYLTIQSSTSRLIFVTHLLPIAQNIPTTEKSSEKGSSERKW
jgi:hypothetical protein